MPGWAAREANIIHHLLMSLYIEGLNTNSTTDISTYLSISNYLQSFKPGRSSK